MSFQPCRHLIRRPLRQPQTERRPFRLPADEIDRAAEITLAEQLHAVGADAAALFPLGAERPLEDLELHFLGHDFRVVDGEDRGVAGVDASERDAAARRGRLEGVLQHVAEDANNELAIGDDRPLPGRADGDFAPVRRRVLQILAAKLFEKRLRRKGTGCVFISPDSAREGPVGTESARSTGGKGRSANR